MILYHFTAARLVGSIRREGITLGGYIDLDGGRVVLRRGYLWLTANSDFYDQEWNSMETIPYDRAEFRITVDIPGECEGNVINWLDFCNAGRVAREVAEALNACGDPHNWRLYKGTIPPAWFRAVDRKLLKIPHKYALVRHG